MIRDAAHPSVPDRGLGQEIVDVGLHLGAVGGHRGAVAPRLDHVELGEGVDHGAIAALSFFRSMCRLRTIDSSRADTPAMCRAASYGPMLVPYPPGQQGGVKAGDVASGGHDRTGGPGTAADAFGDVYRADAGETPRR